MLLYCRLFALIIALPTVLHAQTLEPVTYQENFERRMLGAWASYPHWQDIAYDQNFRVNELVPGDKNISLVQKVTPYTAVDNYAGAQKLLEIMLAPGSTIRFRYYIKTNQAVSNLIVRWAGDSLGKLDANIANPVVNKWQWVDLSYDHFLQQNPAMKGKEQIPVHALAFLAKIPLADPAMPIFFSLDDISVNAKKKAAFHFSLPQTSKLPELETRIATKAYKAGDILELAGEWPGKATKLTASISRFTAPKVLLQQLPMQLVNGSWKSKPASLKLEPGLYRVKITAVDGVVTTGSTELAIRVKPASYDGHPRLLFDEKGKEKMQVKFKTPLQKPVLDDILLQAKNLRTKIPVSGLVFDLDQFPDEDWLPTWSSWGGRIYHTGEALRINARAYAFGGDQVAGDYVRDMLVKLAGWPNWTHPWQTKRGRFSEHRTGSWAHRVAEAYDLVYDHIAEADRTLIRKAIINNIIEGAHKTYVVDDNITGATSNWLAMTLGGSLMNLAAIAGDGPDTDSLETEITGAIFKLDKFLNRVVDSVDGAWGEGFGYNNYSMSNLAYSLPSLQHVFGVDLSAPIRNSFNEFIWGGLIRKKEWFEYGDSGGDMGPANHWAYLLQHYRDPRLSWYYHFMKKAETYEDVVYDVEDIPQDSPFDENPVKAFHDVGTTVFKSGWDTSDMVFVMRSGPFYNHQHIDQGSFWFADKGQVFVEERHLHNSNYYDDPIYQSHLIQPIGHSTILVDSNAQSQRVGDHRSFAKGFNDYAFLANFLDGKRASFSSGDIGRLYWGKLKSLQRNVLYLKPRVVLMIDQATPGDKDVAVTALYQTEKLSSLHPDSKRSTISKGGVDLQIFHLMPQQPIVEALETPHYLKTLSSPVPMEREGMLKITATTKRKPLLLANLFSTLPVDSVTTETKDGLTVGKISGNSFFINQEPGKSISIGSFNTDALCGTWDGQTFLIALASKFSTDGFNLTTDHPIVFETDGNTFLQYNCQEKTKLEWKKGNGKLQVQELAAGSGTIRLTK